MSAQDPKRSDGPEAERRGQQEADQRHQQEAEQRRQQDAEQRRQQKADQRPQQALGVEPSPPPYEAAETPLERLGPGLGYLGGVIGGAFVFNLLLLVLIAASTGS